MASQWLGLENGTGTFFINLERIGASPDAQTTHGVSVVWTATNPDMRGTYVVGWYANATVHRYRQPAPHGSQRYDAKQQEEFGYYIEANASDVHLLDKDERVLRVPRGKGFLGQSNIWYADSAEAKPFLEQLTLLMQQGPSAIAARQKKGASRGRARQSDPLRRALIERRAIEVVAAWYTELGYAVSSVEKDNCGWDLEARQNESRQSILRLEVKGLSGRTVVAELTPNEYRCLQQRDTDYRLCIVTCADNRKKQRLDRFSYSADRGRWENQDGYILDVKEIIAVRVSAKVT